MRSLAWILALVVVFVGVAAGETRAPEPQLRVAALPLSFEPNLGQADSQVSYLARGDGYTLFLTPTEAVFRLQGDGARAVVRMKLAGGNAKALMSGVEILPGKSNYLLGSDPAQWRAGIPQYARVRLDNVYPGIDLVYYSADEGQLEYDFIVAPGADPTAIQFRLAGAGKLGLDPEGDLVLHLGAQQIRWRRPLVYQEIDGHRVECAGRFVVQGRRIRFAVGDYDHSRALVIDPVLSYSTYLAGTDSVRAMAVDSSGHAYVTGATPGSFPVTQGAFQTMYGGGSNDAYVAKFDLTASGVASLVYATYVGGSDNDFANAIAVDSSGNAYITGQTSSANFPTTMGAFDTTLATAPDVFVTKLNSSGSALLYSTYLGGTGTDAGTGIAVDGSGNIYAAGSTSGGFPVTAGAFQSNHGGGSNDAFVVKLNPAGGGASDLVYASYLGGPNFDVAASVAIDSTGHPYLTGTAQSGFPTTAGAFDSSLGGFTDAFLARFNPGASGAASLLYSTLLGGGGSDVGTGVAVDSSGNAYVVGNTQSADFPVTVGALDTTFGTSQDAFVAKLNPAVAGAAGLVYATYMGGTGSESGLSIAVDPSGNASVTGLTPATDFPLVNALQGAPLGQDVFVSKLSSGGSSLIFSSYLGGSGTDRGNAIAVDSAGDIFIAGQADSNNFPTTPNAFQPMGSLNGFVAKITGVTLTPTINAGGVVNAASFAAGQAVAPGSIAAVFGTNLASSTGVALALPLPTSLAGATMKFNGTQLVPDFFVAPFQGNVQIPWELSGQGSATLTDTVEGVTSSGVMVNLATFGPGVFATNQGGTGQGAILIANTPFLAAPLAMFPGSRPAVSGMDFLEVYCTGLGPVTNQPATGAAAVASPLSVTTTTPTVTIGGVNAPVLFSGLAPGFVGLYVVTLMVPAGAPTGSTVPVVLTINGQPANTVTLAVAPPPPTLVSITVTPANPTIQVGDMLQFTATGTFSDSSMQDLTNSVTWGSSATSVASINGGGLATGLAEGQTTISATQGLVSGSTTLMVAPPPGVLQRVNVHTNGTEANAGGVPLWIGVSPEGRFVAFNSEASNLVTGDSNNQIDIFLRDTCADAMTCTPTTIRVSLTNAGAQSVFSSLSTFPAVSSGGRYVAFHSGASDLVTGDTNLLPDMFVRDTCLGAMGCSTSTIRVSVSTAGVQANGPVLSPVMSADGRHVGFESTANTLVANDTNGDPFDNAGSDVFVRDTCRGAGGGCTPTTSRVSLLSNGSQIDGESTNPSMSSTGRMVAFKSSSPPPAPSGILIRDTCVGAGGCTPSTLQATSLFDAPALSGNGRYVAFVGIGVLPGDNDGHHDIYVRDTCLGAAPGCTPTTIQVSLAPDGSQADNESDSSLPPAISADGRYVAFASIATNLVPGGSNGQQQVFVRDTCIGAGGGCTPRTVLVSRTPSGTQANSTCGFVVMSADGRYVAFQSIANNLVLNDNNGFWDVFLARTGF